MNNIDSVINQRIAEIKEKAQQLRWLRKNRDKLADLPDLSLWGNILDFDHLEHKDVIKVVRALGGKWDKRPTGDSEPGKINYERKVDGIQVRCWAGAPPPSCKLVEFEEIIPEQVIPARVVKKKKLVCQGQEPVAVAIANAVQP